MHCSSNQRQTRMQLLRRKALWPDVCAAGCLRWNGIQTAMPPFTLDCTFVFWTRIFVVSSVCVWENSTTPPLTLFACASITPRFRNYASLEQVLNLVLLNVWNMCICFVFLDYGIWKYTANKTFAVHSTHYRFVMYCTSIIAVIS